MTNVNDGQCGLCTHFGEHHPQEDQIVQIRTSHRAPEGYVDQCGRNENIHLTVSPISGCDGFEAV